MSRSNYLLGSYQGVLARVSTRKRRVEREQEAERFHESIHDQEVRDEILNRVKTDRHHRSAIIIDSDLALAPSLPEIIRIMFIFVCIRIISLRRVTQDRNAAILSVRLRSHQHSRGPLRCLRNSSFHNTYATV